MTSFFCNEPHTNEITSLPRITNAVAPSVISAAKAVSTFSLVSAVKNIAAPSVINAAKNIIAPSVISACMLLTAPTPPVYSDEVSIQYLHYDENDARVNVDAVDFSLNKNIGTDNVFKIDYGYDSVSGGTPTWVDAADSSSGGSARTVGLVKESGQLIPIQESYENASFNDRRHSVDLGWIHRFQGRDEIEASVHISDENDFFSYGGSAEYRFNLNNANTTLSLGGSYLKNEYTPSVLANTVDNAPTEKNLFVDSPTRSYEEYDFYNLQTGITQVLTPTSLINVNLFMIIENGYLNNPYFRIIRVYTVKDGTQHDYLFEENRPNTRKAFGTSINYVKELFEKYAFHGGYRFYSDDWDIISHTLDIKVYTEVTRKLTLIPGFRYYTQESAEFYGDRFPEKFSTQYSTTSPQEYASSDFRLNSFDSYEFNLGFDYKINDTITFNATGSTFKQSSGLRTFIITTGFKCGF